LADPLSALVPLKPDGTKPPLFFVHAIGGTVTPYFELASLLDADQPFYALEHPGLSGDTSGRGVSELAASYLAAIQEVQPAGPYHLGGWSFGGVVAAEMAGQLRDRGEEVAIVLVIDSGLEETLSSPDQDSPDQAELLSWFVGDMSATADTAAPSLDLSALRRLAPGQQVDATIAALELADPEFEAIREELRDRIDVFLANTRAHLAHQPSRYDGRLVYLAAADEPEDDIGRWRALVPRDFECHIVPGSHHTVLQPPHVTELFKAIQHCMRDPGSADG
jgi:thioesterase domain-containing protein